LVGIDYKSEEDEKRFAASEIHIEQIKLNLYSNTATIKELKQGDKEPEIAVFYDDL